MLTKTAFILSKYSNIVKYFLLEYILNAIYSCEGKAGFLATSTQVFKCHMILQKSF